ncbi:X-linked retinitis pigmentosa GTPase regulator-like protein [Hapsidospora chrysogenum ATCC 11550]|uniref:X-linked retinitis pigmentosa GTPase regulator-like protein n=1 Tax=Hapsidospora chrysogenum (strain ATCC 11550 / CBS 779.69 / DSM 880 / IAM 14645 / JCM 23072 / IMI 49137) TaxID=857340 RepID=A0A086SUG7_HAPC1|nr:X-linked retinitis pigmentosa GTPase regulator-like protein [Hapsidospora chrysogenum ATCC 11550]
MSSPGPMKLYASGFNAWNQLVFDEEDIRDEPDDIRSFDVVLEGGDIELPISRLSYTLVTRDSKLLKAGCSTPTDDQELNLARSGAENAQVEVPTTTGGCTAARSGPLLRKLADSEALRTGSTSHSWSWGAYGIKQIVAFDAGWVILYDEGTVATLGDARFEDCLAREVTSKSPAEAPGEVPDLNSLGEPIRIIAAGGYTAAAVTESGSLYAWGMESTGMHRRQQAIPGLSGIPNYVEVDGDKDVEDIAVGESHAIALTTDGSVYVIGGNENGQLGLGIGFNERVGSWTKVNLGVSKNHRVVRVGAGPRSSFILVEIAHVKT